MFARPCSFRRTWTLLVCGMLLLLCRPTVASAEAIKLKECPKQVRKTIARELADGKLGDIEELAGDHGALYEVDIVLDGHEYELHIRANGVLAYKQLEGDADERDADSDKEQKQAKRSSNGQKAEAQDVDDEDDADDDDDDDEEDGDDDDDESANAKDEDSAVQLADLPKAVRKTLKLESRGGEIEELERERHKGRVIYAAEVEFDTDSGERVYDIEIDRNGVLLSKVLESDEDEEEEDE